MGVWFPNGVQEQSPWSGVRGAKPPEVKTLSAFGRLLKVANLPTLKKINAKIQIQLVLSF